MYIFKLCLYLNACLFFMSASVQKVGGIALLWTALAPAPWWEGLTSSHMIEKLTASKETAIICFQRSLPLCFLFFYDLSL